MGIRTEPNKNPVDSSEQACGKSRDASFGIVVAVVAATLLWAAVIGLCFSFY